MAEGRVSRPNVCGRFLDSPYVQFFCGQQVFRHDLPFDCSSLTRWRQRLGEERLAALLQESFNVAHKTGALETEDPERVVFDTIVQPKAIAHPTDAQLMHRALVKLVAMAKRSGVNITVVFFFSGERAGLWLDGRVARATMR